MQVVKVKRLGRDMSWNVCKPVAILDKGHAPGNLFRSQCHQLGGVAGMASQILESAMSEEEMRM